MSEPDRHVRTQIVWPADPDRSILALAALHTETEENARLAKLATGAGLLAPTLAILALPMAAVSGGSGAVILSVWLLLVLISATGVWTAYRLTVAPPISPARLREFAHGLGGLLFFCGFSWGTAAFLLNMSDMNLSVTLIRLIAPAMTIVILLPEWEAAAAFLIPDVAMSAFACAAKPVAGSMLDAAAVVIAGLMLFLLARVCYIRRRSAIPAMIAGRT